MERHRNALVLAATALVLGLTADLLLRWIPWGINLLIATTVLVVLCLICARRMQRRIALFPAACALIAAAGVAWRDSLVLRALDVAVVAVAIPLLALLARGIRLSNAGLSEVANAVITTGAQSVAGFPQLLFSDLAWRQLPRQGALRAGAVLARGVVIAVPALILFSILLISADAAFEKFVKDLLFFNLRELVIHVIVTLVLAAMFAGFLRSLFFSGEALRFSRPSFLRLAAPEVSIALTLINILFAAFVALQFRYFFGTANAAEVAGYARRGFFELVAVVTLVLPMLLVIEWLVDKSNATSLRIVRLLAALQITLVLLIVASAYHRMRLYRDEYGLTEPRLYATAFMIWLSVLLLWFVITVLTGRRERFAIGAVVTAVLALAILHIINPDALIIRTNFSRIHRRDPDQIYAMRLGEDATAEIIAYRAKINPLAWTYFVNRPRPLGWRTWNVSRARAKRLIKPYESYATPPRPR